VLTVLAPQDPGERVNICERGQSGNLRDGSPLAGFRAGTVRGSGGQSPQEAETFLHIYMDKFCHCVVPLKLFQFRKFKAAVYAIKQL